MITVLSVISAAIGFILLAFGMTIIIVHTRTGRFNSVSDATLVEQRRGKMATSIPIITAGTILMLISIIVLISFSDSKDPMQKRTEQGVGMVKKGMSIMSEVEKEVEEVKKDLAGGYEEIRKGLPQPTVQPAQQPPPTQQQQPTNPQNQPPATDEF